MLAESQEAAEGSAEDTGLAVVDPADDPAFLARPLRPRDNLLQMAGMQRLARAFVDEPDTLLQQLVSTAMELCGADSAGISLVREEATDECYYEWVATAGNYTGFLNALLPRYPSACGVTLERGRPQLFRVTPKFFDILGVVAEPVTDGLLLPWQVDGTRGTIFVMAHDRAVAFDSHDMQIMQLLANFAAMAVRHQRQQRKLIEQAEAAGAADLAHRLAHQINNPLQILTNQVYLASTGGPGDAKVLANDMAADLSRLSTLVSRILNLSTAKWKNAP